MELLAKFEEFNLLPVWRLGNNAYGTTIYKHLLEITGKRLSFGDIYFPLDRLTKRGHLDGYTGEATIERRGLNKRHYRLTRLGEAALDEIHRIIETL